PSVEKPWTPFRKPLPENAFPTPCSQPNLADREAGPFSQKNASRSVTPRPARGPLAFAYSAEARVREFVSARLARTVFSFGASAAAAANSTSAAPVSPESHRTAPRLLRPCQVSLASRDASQAARASATSPAAAREAQRLLKAAARRGLFRPR